MPGPEVERVSEILQVIVIRRSGRACEGGALPGGIAREVSPEFEVPPGPVMYESVGVLQHLEYRRDDEGRGGGPHALKDAQNVVIEKAVSVVDMLRQRRDDEGPHTGAKLTQGLRSGVLGEVARMPDPLCVRVVEHGKQLPNSGRSPRAQSPE
jgi:hypothetical protein